MRRRLLSALFAGVVAAALLPAAAQAQSRQQQRDRDPTAPDHRTEAERNEERLAPLRGSINAGPCPYVKILYDAARYVEMGGERASASNVGYTGEIEGVSSNCSYQVDEPITVDMALLFRLGRGPQAQGDQRTYRYWIAVTERNRAVLHKQYIDLPVDFEGGATASVEDERTVVIPRATNAISGNNFEVLIGFDVTPQMADFNRSGSRFRINAGVAQAAPAAQ